MFARHWLDLTSQAWLCCQWWKAWNATTCFESFQNNPFPTKENEPAGGQGATFNPGTLNHIFLCGGIGHWFWRHLVGLTPAAPGFAAVQIAPKIHDQLGPQSVQGEFVSAKGTISSAWAVEANGVRLEVSLPVGVGSATIVVPKPMADGKAAASAVVKLHGTVVWDGNKLVGTPEGIDGAKDTPEGVAFDTTNGAFNFESTAAASRNVAE